MDDMPQVGERVRHVDHGGTAVLVRYWAGWDVVVRWESTGRETTENIAYLERV